LLSRVCSPTLWTPSCCDKLEQELTVGVTRTTHLFEKLGWLAKILYLEWKGGRGMSDDMELSSNVSDDEPFQLKLQQTFSILSSRWCTVVVLISPWS
jgi:hypothetical protein